MSTLKPTTIRNFSLVVALLLAPILSYGSAYMLYKQIDTASDSNAKQALAKVPVQPKETLPQELIDQIAAAIAMAEQDG